MFTEDRLYVFNTECQIVCHPKCASSLPATCGLPTEYARHFTDTMAKAQANDKNVSVANLKLQHEGWMQTPKYNHNTIE